MLPPSEAVEMLIHELAGDAGPSPQSTDDEKVEAGASGRGSGRPSHSVVRGRGARALREDVPEVHGEEAGDKTGDPISRRG